MPRRGERHPDRRIANPSPALPRGPHAKLTDAVVSAALGSLDGQRLVALVRRGEANDHALHALVGDTMQQGDPHRLRSLQRTVQKSMQ